MPNVIIRVELNGEPDGEVYDALHKLMAAHGFSKGIQSAELGNVDLPHAMYSGPTTEPPGELARQLSAEIRESIWAQSIVLVVEWNKWGQAAT